LDQKLVQVLTGISVNAMRACSGNLCVRAIGLRKLEPFDPVAQGKTSFHLQQTLQNRTTQTTEKIKVENPLMKQEVTAVVKFGKHPQKLAMATRSERFTGEGTKI
jgi:flagellar basal body P-ring protein FlgI